MTGWRKCSVVGCWRRGKHREVETYGYQGLLAFGSSEVIFWHCDNHAKPLTQQADLYMERVVERFLDVR